MAEHTLPTTLPDAAGPHCLAAKRRRPLLVLVLFRDDRANLITLGQR